VLEREPENTADNYRETSSELHVVSETENGHENRLAEQNIQLDLQVKAALAEKVERMSSVELPPSDTYSGTILIQDISQMIQALGYNPDLGAVGRPTQKNSITKDVDLAFNAAGMSKAADKHPVDVARELAVVLLDHVCIAEAGNVGPFVNIGLDYQVFAPKVLGEINELGPKFGYFRDGKPQRVIIDYSSPNVAKNMTVAHLRSTIIGHSLMKIQAASGNIPFGINHIGDWGTQFGNIIYEYKKELAERGDEFITELNADPTATLMKIYRAFTSRKDSDPEAVSEAQNIFLKLEQGDPELVELWDQFKVWSLRDFGPSYDRLGIRFDAIQGESFYENRMLPTVQDSLSRGVLKTNASGAIIFPAQPLGSPTTGIINDRVMLDPDGNPRDEIIIKPTGGTVYLTRDLAAIRYRGQELGADKILYVIGKEQYSHCLELFAMADQMDYMPLGCAEHISFGHLNVDGRKMKSREGKVALLNETLDESVAAAASMLQIRKTERGDHSRELTPEEVKTARQIGIGAVIFNDLKQNREKDIEFDPDKAKSLEAGSSAYIQYTNSRLGSILQKVGEPEPLETVPEGLAITEKRIVTEMARLPLVIKEAALLNSPHKIASYLTEFCQTLNLFYQEQPIATASSDIERNFRLNLVKAARQVINNSADLLHLELPEKM
jgi:arginyl-tRNA synthetase